MKNDLIIGLDISSTCVGYSIISKDIELIDLGFNLVKESDLFDNAKYSINKINELFEKYDINYGAVEDFLKKFSVGKSSAQIIARLASINSIISFHLKQKCKNIQFFHPVNARKIAFGTSFLSKIEKEEAENGYENIKSQYSRKHQIYLKAKQLYPDLEKFSTYKFNKKKNINELDGHCYDMCDAFTLSCAFAKSL